MTQFTKIAMVGAVLGVSLMLDTAKTEAKPPAASGGAGINRQPASTAKPITQQQTQTFKNTTTNNSNVPNVLKNTNVQQATTNNSSVPNVLKNSNVHQGTQTASNGTNNKAGNNPPKTQTGNPQTPNNNSNKPHNNKMDHCHQPFCPLSYPYAYPTCWNQWFTPGWCWSGSNVVVVTETVVVPTVIDTPAAPVYAPQGNPAPAGPTQTPEQVAPQGPADVAPQGPAPAAPQGPADVAPQGPAQVAPPAPVQVPPMTQASAAGVDVEMVEVRIVEMGDGTKTGPLVRVVIGNKGVEVTQEFNVAVAASSGRQMTKDSPQSMVRVKGLKAGEAKTIDLRLAPGALKMAFNSDGQPLPFGFLLAMVDTHGELPDRNLDNNVLHLQRQDIAMVAR